MEKALMLRCEDVEPRRVDALALTIVEHHQGTQAALGVAFEHMVACGEALAEARRMVPSGHWNAWLRDNVAMSDVTARLYVRIFAFRQELELVGVSSLHQARRYLRENDLVLEIARRPVSDDAVIKVKALVEHGLTQQEAAERAGVGISTVKRILKGEHQAKRGTTRPDRRPAPTEITDQMIEGMAKWLAVRYKLPLTDETRLRATEALRVALNYRRLGDARRYH